MAFYPGFAPNGGELPLIEKHGVSTEAFEKMLEYVYTNEIEYRVMMPILFIMQKSFHLGLSE